jgi:fermentation-respiration switch protein FrsA (DUF1100 family)
MFAAVLAWPAAAPAQQAGGARYGVGMRTFKFVDKSRRTDPNLSYKGARSRTLRTLVLYPTAGDPGGPAVKNARPLRRRAGHRFPLVVFAHGFGASGPTYRPVIEPYVRAGYVVAAPTFPLSSQGAPGGPPVLTDYVNQPGDVSYVITRMLRLSRGKGFLTRTVNRHEIGAMGHSLGAVTTLGLVANSCCRDPRVDAASAWSGLEVPFPKGRFFSRKAPPLLFVHGDSDQTVMLSGGRKAYEDAPAPKALLTMIGGGHVFFFAPWADPFTRTVTDFLDGYLKHSAAARQRIATDGNLAGVASVTEQLR